jgi:hypothetical protein
VLVSVDRWPLLHLKIVVEYLTLQKWANGDSFLENNGEILPKKEETDVIILILNDVVNDHLDSPKLITSQSNVQGIPVEILGLILRALIVLILIKYGIGRREVLFEVVTQQRRHRATVEGQD